MKSTSSLLIGLSALIVGTIFYITARSPEYIYFLPDTFSLYRHDLDIFGVLGRSLPTFTHVFAFILITSAFLPSGRKRLLVVCAIWFSIDVAFEVGQHPSVATQLLPYIPGWFQQIPVLENTCNYFTNGTFDALDIISIALGSIAAFMTNSLLIRQGEDHGDNFK